MRTHPDEVNSIGDLSVIEQHDYERHVRRARSKRNRLLQRVGLGVAPPPPRPAGRGTATTEDPPPAEAHIDGTGTRGGNDAAASIDARRSAPTNGAQKGVVGETVPPPAPAFPPMGALGPIDAGPAAAPDPGLDVELDDLELDPPARPHRLRHRLGVGQSVRATVTVFVALPLAALLVACAALWAATSRPAPITAGSGAGGAAAVGPAGFAQQYVAAWLRAGDQTAATLKAWYPGPVDLTGKVPDATYAVTAVAVQITSQGTTGQGAYWSVLVAADVAERPPTTGPDGQAQGAYQDRGLHYYRVSIWQRPDQSMTATGLPAQEAAPKLAAAPGPLITADQPPDPSDPRVDTLTRWANALLTGQGELGRYQDPDVPAAAIDPPPYRRLVLRSVGYAPIPGAKDKDAATAVAARLVLTAIDAQNNEQVLDYSVRLGFHDQRWYVTRVALAPALSPTRATPGGSR